MQRLNNAVKKRSAGAQILLSEHVQALWHSYRPLTWPDRGLLERCDAVSGPCSQHIEPTILCCTTARPALLLDLDQTPRAENTGVAGEIILSEQIKADRLVTERAMWVQVAAPPC